MFRATSILTFSSLVCALHAAPLPEGSYVDLIVVPVGPVPLATFERVAAAATPVAAPAAPKSADNRQAPPPTDGGGIRVKDVDPTELPPTAVFIRKSGRAHYQVSCHLNAMGAPVRVPVTDSEITLQVRSGTGGALTDLGKITLTKLNQPLLVLLTKPLNEKKWTQPALTTYPVGGPGGIVFINASQTLGCGINVNGKAQLVAALQHKIWQAPPNTPDPEIMLAMRDAGGQYLPPFFNTTLSLEPEASLIIINYEVTPQESFRCGKYAMGTLSRNEFRPAEIFPPEEKPARPAK